MIHSSLIILYCIISIAGAIAFFSQKREIPVTERLSMLFFISIHFVLCILGVAQFFTSVPLWLFLVSIVLMFVSRICNGLMVYGKNNWHHYLVTGSMMLVIFGLYFYDI